MKINYCKITEDLMPLYFDELTSTETKEFIEWHLDQCNDCRGKYRIVYEKVPDIKPNKVNFKEEDKFQSAKRFLLKVRKRMYMTGIFVLIIMLIASTVSFLYGKRSNNEAPIKVTSAEDFANRVVPGWQRALKSGQIVDIGVSKPIPGTEAIVTFDKVWYTPSYTYVLYTVKEPNKNYLMASKKVIDIPPEEYTKNNSSMEPLAERLGGISSEGYHQIMVFMGYNTPVPAKEVTLTVSNWRPPKRSITLGSVDTIQGMISVELPLSDEFLREKFEKIALDKSYEWEGRSFRINGLEVGTSKTLLYGEAKLLHGETLNHIEGFIRSGEQSAGLNYESIVPGDAPNSFKFIFYTEPLNQWPSKIWLDIRAIQFKTPQVLNFPIDWTLYAGKKGKRDVLDEPETAVSFYSSTVKLLSIDPEGLVGFQISEPSQKSMEGKPYITMSSEPMFVDPLNNYSSGLKITNENGDMLQVGNTVGGNLYGNDKVGIGFEIDTEDELWKTSKKITITISKPNARLVVNQKININ